MLWCNYGTSCTSTTSNATQSGTASSTTDYCRCPNCGWMHEPDIIRVSFSAFELEEPPRLYRRIKWWQEQGLLDWPLPQSDRRRPIARRCATRSGFDRPGRQLRHRGGMFRNFYKLRD